MGRTEIGLRGVEGEGTGTGMGGGLKGHFLRILPLPVLALLLLQQGPACQKHLPPRLALARGTRGTSATFALTFGLGTTTIFRGTTKSMIGSILITPSSVEELGAVKSFPPQLKGKLTWTTVSGSAQNLFATRPVCAIFWALPLVRSMESLHKLQSRKKNR